MKKKSIQIKSIITLRNEQKILIAFNFFISLIVIYIYIEHNSRAKSKVVRSRNFIINK